MKDKIYNLLNKIYGLVMVFAFFTGFIPVIPFIVAIVVGGTIGENIVLYMYEKVYPVAFVAASVSVITGLIAMYIRGKKSMSVESYGKEE